jgi:fluoroquinolone resistance protein
MIEISSGCEYEYQEFKNINSDRGLVAQAEFQNCTFSQCDFSRSTFDGCRFYDCTFQSCDLSLMNPKDSSYRHSTLENCKLVGVDWAKASEGFSADFDNCIISLSNFFGMNLKKRRIVNCVAHEVDFSGSNMTGCDCRMTDFLNSTFSKTNLTKADFSKAKNYAIDYRINILTQAKFSLPEAVALLELLEIVVTD